jgi:hypothetical protein
MAAEPERTDEEPDVSRTREERVLVVRAAADAPARVSDVRAYPMLNPERYADAAKRGRVRAP